MALLDGEVTSAALCWRLERLDGAGIGLTSHDAPVAISGVRYEPVPGITPASVTRNAGLDAHSGEIAGSLNSAALNDIDLAIGRWDGAQVALEMADWKDPDEQSLQLIGGELANVAVDGNAFTANLRGAAAKLDAPVCPATSAECRAQFGDKSCRVDLAGRTVSAAVVATEDGTLTLDRSVDERFVLGRLRYMSGANCGLSSVVLGVAGVIVQLRDLPRAPVEVGCRVELREGCDKRLETCVTRFANAGNFRGEPYLPGVDLLTRYPGA